MAYMSRAMLSAREFVKAASTSEIAPGQARLVTVKGREIVLFNVEGAFALANACPHEEGPLAEGEVSGHEVTCPWHGAGAFLIVHPAPEGN
jgi:nitrite reductase/ring-hydroxylating ferredoxin subunit